MPPSIEVVEVDAVGNIQKINAGERGEIDKWTRQAGETFVAAVQKELNDRPGLVAKTVLEESMLRDARANLLETYHLFDAVDTSVIRHAYERPGHDGDVFPDKVERFDFSLGEEVRGIDIGEKDAVLVIKLNCEVWTTGRKALVGTLAALYFAGVAGELAATGTEIAADITAGCFACVPLGSTVFYGWSASLALQLGAGLGGAAITPKADYFPYWSGVRIALVDVNTGSILWYNKVSFPVENSLTDPTRAADLAKALFQELPLGK